MPKHLATGKPRGRPPILSTELGDRIMAAFRTRIDPESGLVKPDWKELARELNVSRSTISRQVKRLHDSGSITSVSVPISPKVSEIRYRLSDRCGNQ